MLSGDDLTVQTFIGATAIALLGIAVTQAGWTHKQFVRSLFITGGILGVIALFWGPIIRLWPSASNISIGPWAWLLLITLAVGAISWLEIAAREKRRASIPLAELRHEIDRLRDQVSGVAKNQGEANVGLTGMIGRVEDKADKIALNVQSDIRSIREDIKRLSERTEQQYEMTGQGQMRLRNAILARDAEALVKEQDKIIVDLGVRLLAADSQLYVDSDSPAKAWLSDFELWESAIAEIDRIVGTWQPSHKRLLDVSRHDYERTPNLPPNPINSDPANSSRFKTVCIVHDRYMQRQSNIAEYFSAKIRDSL